MNVIFSFTKNNFLRIISAGALLFIIASAFISCDDKMMYEENREIKDNTWDMKNQLSFDFDVPDTNTKYNFYFHTKFPNGKMGNDTVEFPLADDQGHWYGKGQGDLYDCRLIFRQGVRFPLAGKYHMDIEQAMRMEQLPGIQSAGIRIERAE